MCGSLSKRPNRVNGRSGPMAIRRIAPPLSGSPEKAADAVNVVGGRRERCRKRVGV
ncbi:uncharacterized protein G2W53_018427 [Senna tora]|uniref:Uncharacterized protein n=1 Tax=Senna tora TaxID=362788 RepID=A0A834TRS2_9FABA|nr:uncharacterized protein G2W53_018427 [Senna tora]